MTPPDNHPSTILMVLIGLAVVGGVLVLGSARKAARDTGRALSLGGRVLAVAAVIVAAQWAIWTYSHDTTLRVVALAAPALVAAAGVTKTLTIPGTVGKRGGRR